MSAYVLQACSGLPVWVGSSPDIDPIVVFPVCPRWYERHHTSIKLDCFSLPTTPHFTSYNPQQISFHVRIYVFFFTESIDVSTYFVVFHYENAILEIFLQPGFCQKSVKFFFFFLFFCWKKIKIDVIVLNEGCFLIYFARLY